VYTGFIRGDGLKTGLFEEEALVCTKIRLKGLSASIRLGAVLALLSAGSLQADFIWQNNNLLGSSTFNDSNTNAGANPQWTVFDNFTTPTTNGQSWNVNTVDFTDYLVNAPTSGKNDVKSTTWSIWSGDPLKTTGTLVATGSATPGISPNANGSYTFTISGLNVVLSAGTQYYLGTTNTVSQDGGTQQATSTFRARASSPGLPGSTAYWEQSNGTINTGAKNFDSGSASNTSVQNGTFTVFDVQGNLTPEPGTWALMGIAMAGFYLIRRRRIA
jgi:PEP-CTERM motif